jgi:hypothetical protein
MKNYFKDFIFFYHKLFLFFFSVIIVVTSVLYHFNFTHYNRNLYLAIYISLFLLIGFLLREKNFLIKLFLCILLFFISSIISGSIYDLSADGRSSHMQNIFNHLNNYNPFNDPCAGISLKRDNELLNYMPWSGTHNAQFNSHAIVFVENIFVLFTDNIEASKALKILIFLSSIYPVIIFLNEFKSFNKFKNLFFFIILVNPIVITQLLDSYKDFYGYYLILNSLIFFFLILKKKILDKEIFYLLLLNLFLLASTKFNFYAFSIVFTLIFFFIIFLKFRIKKIIYLAPIFLLFLTLFANYTPAAKSFIRYSNFFVSEEEYLKIKPPCFATHRSPIIDSRRADVIKFNNESSRIYRLFHGFLSKGSLEEWNNYPGITKENLYQIDKNDFYFHFYNGVPMYGGGGPLFGKIFLILILFSLIFIFKNISFTLYKNYFKKINYELGLFLIIFLSIIIFPYPNVFRFVPHVWLLPILIFLMYFNLRIKSLVVNILFLFFVLNIILVLYSIILGAFYGQNMFKRNNKIFFDNIAPKERINGWVSNWGYQLYQYSLISNNFNIKNFKPSDMTQCKVIYNSFNTQGNFCLDGLENQEKIIKEINSNQMFYKDIVYKLSRYKPKDVLIDFIK